MNKEEVKSLLESKKTERLMTVILIIACVIIVFHTGEEFGYKKEQLMDNVSNGYYKTLGPGDVRRTGPFGYLFDDQTGTHGVSGKVISVTADKILVEDNEGIEKTVLVDSNTTIKKQRATISESDIKPDDFMIVIGSPTTDGQVDAKIIRILPPPGSPPEDMDSASTTSGSSTLPTF